MRLRLALASMLVLPLVTFLPSAAAEMKSSGTIVTVDQAAGKLVIEELTASAGPKPVSVRRTIELGTDTKVELVQRAPESQEGRQGFVSSPLSAGDLKPGDFVTVTADREGDRLRARAVEVVRPGGAR